MKAKTKMMLALGALACAGASAVAIGRLCTRATVAYAEGDETSETETVSEDTSEVEVVSSEEEAEPTIVVKVEQKYDEVKGWVEDRWNTFVAPLIGGVSITAIASFLMTMLMNYLKNKRLDKKLEQANKTFADAQDTLATIKAIYDGIEAEKSINQEMLSKLGASITDINERLDEATKAIDRAKGIEPALRIMTELQIELAKHNRDMVANGSADKAQEIKKLIGGQ